jgi:hypothetical protein
MAGILLENFSYRLSNTVLSDVVKNVNKFNFDPLNDISASNNFITFDNSSNLFRNGDKVHYYTNTGNTANFGIINNNTYYVLTSNSSGISLTTSVSGSVIDITTGPKSETGHYIEQFFPQYYFVAAKYSPWGEADVAQDVYDNTGDINSLQRELIFGKKVNSNDVAYMIPDYEWTANTIYAQYDDSDPILYEKQFYVRNSSNNIYKCLDNYNATNAASTVEPTHVGTDSVYTDDGYRWKYMYTLSSANNNKFTVYSADVGATFIPLDANTSVTAAAANGSIECINIENVGAGYTFNSNVGIISIVNSNTFQISSIDNLIQPLATGNNYYDTCGFYVYQGTGAGSLTVINEYIQNNSGYYINTADDIDVDVTSIGYISPQVKIEGDGTGAKAYSTINTTQYYYIIDKIIIVNSGQDYSYATANIVANSSFGTGAQLRPIMSPKGGHGANIQTELGASYVCFATNFSNNENGTIPTEITYRKVGLLYDPQEYLAELDEYVSYTANTFNALTSFDYTLQGVLDFDQNEVITGGTSNATAVIAFVNNSIIEASPLLGSFTLNETITGSNSGATAIISNINNSDIQKYSGTVLYLDGFDPVQRSNTATESVKLLVNL